MVNGVKKIGVANKNKAKKHLRQGGDIIGSSKSMKKLQKEKGKGKPIKEKHGDGTSHWHRGDREGGHAFVEGVLIIPGSNLGHDIFGDNLLGDAVNTINPISDVQDIADIIDFTNGDDSFEGEECP